MSPPVARLVGREMVIPLPGVALPPPPPPTCTTAATLASARARQRPR